MMPASARVVVPGRKSHICGVFESYVGGKNEQKLVIDWACKLREREESELAVEYLLVLLIERECRKGTYDVGRC